jgi:hypothetical protein
MQAKIRARILHVRPPKRSRECGTMVVFGNMSGKVSVISSVTSLVFILEKNAACTFFEAQKFSAFAPRYQDTAQADG